MWVQEVGRGDSRIGLSRCGVYMQEKLGEPMSSHVVCQVLVAYL